MSGLYGSPGAQGQLANLVFQPSRNKPSGKKI